MVVHVTLDLVGLDSRGDGRGGACSRGDALGDGPGNHSSLLDVLSDSDDDEIRINSIRSHGVLGCGSNVGNNCTSGASSVGGDTSNVRRGRRNNLGGLARDSTVAGTDVVTIGITSANARVLGAVGDQVASRKLLHGSPDFLIELGLDGALRVLISAADGEFGTHLDDTGGVRAGVDCTLENILLPPVHEVSVVRVSELVTGREDELSALASEGVNIPDGLEEQRRHTDRVSLGTVTVVHGGRIGHVRAVIERVIVLSIPAAGEEHLGAQSVGAVTVLGDRVDTQSSVSRLSVVQAVEADSTLTEEVLVSRETQSSPVRALDVQIIGGVAATGITSDDAQVRGEGLDVFTAQEVVDEHAASLVEGGQFPRLGLVVQVWRPVRRVVLLHLARGTVRGSQIVAGDVATERATAVDSVHVVTNDAGGIDRINSLEDQSLPARQTPEGVRLQGEEGGGKEQSLAEHVCLLRECEKGCVEGGVIAARNKRVWGGCFFGCANKEALANE